MVDLNTLVATVKDASRQKCPVGGSCQARSVVYEATVAEIVSGKKETYTGVTSRRFKDRYYEHRTDMNNRNNRTNSALCSHVWDLKDRGIGHDVTWKLKTEESLIILQQENAEYV